MIVTVDCTAAATATPGGPPGPTRSAAATAVGATKVLPAGWYSSKSPSWTSATTVSPGATSLNRLTSGGTLTVSVLPSSPCSVSLRAAVSTATTLAVMRWVRIAAASPGTPADCTSTGGGPDGFDALDEAHAASRNA